MGQSEQTFQSMFQRYIPCQKKTQKIILQFIPGQAFFSPRLTRLRVTSNHTENS